MHRSPKSFVLNTTRTVPALSLQRAPQPPAGSSSMPTTLTWTYDKNGEVQDCSVARPATPASTTCWVRSPSSRSTLATSSWRQARRMLRASRCRPAHSGTTLAKCLAGQQPVPVEATLPGNAALPQREYLGGDQVDNHAIHGYQARFGEPSPVNLGPEAGHATFLAGAWAATIDLCADAHTSVHRCIAC